MAIYHQEWRVIRRREETLNGPRAAKGRGGTHARSVVAAAAYRSGQRIEDERYQTEQDYSRKQNVVASEIMAPENAPAWVQDRAALWNTVEQSEKRKDSQLAREVQLSLPHELGQEAQRELVREFVQEQFVSRGMVADVSYHTHDKSTYQPNDHAHVLLTMREIGPQGFGQKQREWNSRELVQESRQRWAELANDKLHEHGQNARIDHRTLEVQRQDHWEKAEQYQDRANSGRPSSIASPFEQMRWQNAPERAANLSRAAYHYRECADLQHEPKHAPMAVVQAERAGRELGPPQRGQKAYQGRVPTEDQQKKYQKVREFALSEAQDTAAEASSLRTPDRIERARQRAAERERAEKDRQAREEAEQKQAEQERSQKQDPLELARRDPAAAKKQYGAAQEKINALTEQRGQQIKGKMLEQLQDMKYHLDQQKRDVKKLDGQIGQLQKQLHGMGGIGNRIAARFGGPDLRDEIAELKHERAEAAKPIKSMVDQHNTLLAEIRKGGYRSEANQQIKGENPELFTQRDQLYKIKLEHETRERRERFQQRDDGRGIGR